MDTVISAMTPEDWPAVRSIYLDGMATGQATFETRAPDWDAWDRGHRPDCRLVARSNDTAVGWAALSHFSTREVYAGVCEVSIYIASAARRRGVGDALLAALIAESEKKGIWTLQAGIFPENGASLGLHNKHGFRVVGRRERLGRLNGQWKDVILMERRSREAGL